LIARIFTLVVLLVLTFGCDKKADENKTQSNTNEFGWTDGVSGADIPDFGVKGNLEGKEVQFAYVNFERWRGSNDNVINFSLVKPVQNCGFIENFSGFTLISKGAAFNQGEWIKAGFGDDNKNHDAYFKSGSKKSSEAWNCALNIESINDKTVKGKIILFFNDGVKSWVAGGFEAVICNN
jgi:hypothetical protein